MPHTLKITVLDAQNSLPFLAEVFRLYGAGTAFAICRPGTEMSDYPALEVVERIATGAQTGWMTPRLGPPAQGEGLAQVVFSSGTEGKPKAIALSRAALADVEDRLLEVMQVTSEIREYIGVPVTYSFGLGRARVVARAGGSLYLPERFDPVELRDMLAAGEINAISAVPSLWRILLARPDFLGDLGARVRWIEIGSQYMSGAEKLALRQMFPKARIVQHYGLTEASRSTFLVIDAAPEAELESVGGPVGQTEIRIGAEGEICIRGPHLATGLFDAAGDLVPVAGAEGWLHTRDRGELIDGRLYYRGRMDDQINLSGIKLSAEAIEAEVGALLTLEPGHFALSSIEDPLRGEVLLLGHDRVAAPQAGLLQAALAQVLASKGIQAGPVRMLALDELPRTGSGKIRRKDLRVLQEAGASSDRPALQPAGQGLSPAEERIAEVWRSVLGPVALTPASGFYDVGGDSLGAMQIGLAMEAQFPGPMVRATLEGRSLAEIAALEEDTAQTPGSAGALPVRTVRSWAVNVARGLMVISVLLSHWMPGIWDRLAPGLSFDPLAFISRMGTPGFAIVFGIGISCFMLDGYPGNRQSVRRRQRFSVLMVFGAMVLTAAIQLALLALTDGGITGRELGEAFYNVLAFYLLALLTLPLWLRLLHGRVLAVAAIGIPLCWILWRLAVALIGQDLWDSPLEWLRLMAVAKYSYFGMSTLVLAGVALGHWMMHAPDLRVFSRQAALVGGSMIACGAIMVSEFWSPQMLLSRSAPFWWSLLGAMIYTGFTTLLLAVLVQLLAHWRGLWAPMRGGLRGLILFGGMALPIFALHRLVIPLKDMLVLEGLSPTLALVLPLVLLFTVIGYGMWRLDRMYFR